MWVGRVCNIGFSVVSEVFVSRIWVFYKKRLLNREINEVLVWKLVVDLVNWEVWYLNIIY